jgi:arylsulfatase A-like enzyme
MNMKTRTTLLAAGMLLAALASTFAQPVISNQPQSQTALGGATVIFSVGAHGTPPLFYQWRSYANSTTFTNIPWGTEATLALTNVQPTSRKFGVVVTNVEGAVTSVLASLTVPLSLTTQPTNYIADVGATATFSALAVGTTRPIYQWRFQDQNLPNRTNANLYLRNLGLTNAGAYTVVVTNVAGSITSQVATLTVVTPFVTRTSGTNILFIIADDYGTDSSSLYNTNARASLPPTPNINSLYDSGVLFRNAYAYPTCSPTRSCLLTGRYGFRTGIGLTIDYALSDVALQANELTIPKILTAHPQLGYPHASIGKWHLGPQPTDPNVRGGWAYFSGSLPYGLDANGVDNYFRWSKTVNGVTTINTNYATTDNVNDALTWIQRQGTTNWFLWLAFNAPHMPFHRPPKYLHSYEALPANQGAIDQNPRPYFEAMTEAMDTELGRLLSHIDRSNTVVIFIGDNGTTSEVIQPPFSAMRAKFTLYEGGIRVPMIISGPVVADPHRDDTNLVHAVDLFATILELAGANLRQVLPTNLLCDSHSLLPILTNGPVTPREWVLSEQFDSSLTPAEQGRAIRDPTFKLIRFKSGTEEFYNLLVDSYETTNLLRNALTPEQSSHYAALTATLAGLQNVPEVTGISYTSNRFAVSVGYFQGVPFSLHRSPSLGSSAWTRISALSQSNNFIVTLTHTNATDAQSYYRVASPVR